MLLQPGKACDMTNAVECMNNLHRTIKIMESTVQLSAPITEHARTRPRLMTITIDIRGLRDWKRITCSR